MVRPSAGGHVGSLHFFATVSNAAVNIYVQVLVRCSLLVFLGKHLGVELPGHMLTF